MGPIQRDALLALLTLLYVTVVRAQDAGVVIPVGDPATSMSSAADILMTVSTADEVGISAATTAILTTTIPPVVVAIPVTETLIPTTRTSAPTTALPMLVSAGDSSVSLSASGSADAAITLPDVDGSTDGTRSTLTRAKLIVIIVLSAAGACVMLALLGWCCTRTIRGRRAKPQPPSTLAVVIPGPEGALGSRYDLTGGPHYDRSDSHSMIAVMGDPADDKRPSRLSRVSTNHQRSRTTSRATSNAFEASQGVLAPAYRLSRPLDVSTSPSSFRGTIQLEHPAISSSRGSAASRLSPYRGLDYGGGRDSASDASSSADDRPSYSSLVEFRQSARGGEGIMTAAGLIRTSTTVTSKPPSPTVAVLELHRFSGASSTASLSSLSSFQQQDQPSRVRSIVVRDLTQLTAEGDFRSSASSSSMSSLVEGLGFSDGRGNQGDADAARLEWYNSIKSPADDDRYTRLSLGESDDGERRSGSGSGSDRQSYEL